MSPTVAGLHVSDDCFFLLLLCIIKPKPFDTHYIKPKPFDTHYIKPKPFDTHYIKPKPFDTHYTGLEADTAT